VGATVAVFLVLVAGITGTTIALVRASRAEQVAAQRQQDAERSAAIAAAVNEFLNNDLLSSVSPDQSGRNTTVKEVLDRASVSIEDRFQKSPLVEAAIRMTLGTTYHKLGQYEDAEPHMRRAVQLQEAWRGVTAPELLESKVAAAELLVDLGRLEEADRWLNEVGAALRANEQTDHLADRLEIALGALRIAQGRYDEAEAHLSDGARSLTARLGPEQRDVLAARTSLAKAKTFSGRYPEAEGLYEGILEVQRRTLGGAHPDTIATTNLLASLYLRQEENQQALRLLQETHRATIDALGEQHPESISVLINIAAAHKMLGNFDEAEPMYLRAIDLCDQYLPPNHAERLVVLNNLARLYDAQGAFDRAEPVYLDALERRREALGVDHPDTCGVEENLAAMYRRMGRTAEARQLIEHVLEARLAQLGPEHRETIFSMYQLGSLLLQLGRVDEAEVHFAEALSNARSAFDERNPWIGKYMLAHAESLMKLKRYEEAEQELQTAHGILAGSVGPQDALTRRAAQRLAEVLDATGRSDEADEWRGRSKGGAEE
jgi:tetratricopeptide (TPR) repeat protein